ncbi:GNAT family N-acetyltransferase [Vagococcus xieshaowenii]|uniref:N-acetyltransferase family protein n=1 Tax=Vagococcus xieshaowenii TaxID=2562451 RepID=A0AAJ5EGE6_9ENTE|nr:GNAT family N-acetyltransferase [Vagococcus xieshaowenii]QCA28458.1 N-acetyltransferase family protein [Vagococcus xieshaowenii]TFZ42787.1 N-acetyltransferase family protein [Vagococcus xieshaowenii]
MDVIIRPVTVSDSESLTTIYNYYIKETTSSFESESITVDMMKERIEEITKSYPYFVAETSEKEIIGYCHAKPFGKTIGYQYSVEVTVYLKPNAKQQGVGTRLYEALERQLKSQGIKTMIASVTAENKESVLFHQKKGYEQAAYLKNIGFKFDRWLDVIWLQKIFS